MKKKINIYSNVAIKNFLNILLSKYELTFFKIEDIGYNFQNTEGNIIFIISKTESGLINFKDLTNNYLIISSLEKNKINFYDNLKLIEAPVSINYLINMIESFLQNLTLQFHDISVDNEKLTNLNNNTCCYLTKIEIEILSYLIREKETSKNFIKEQVLKIKSNIETNSLESHLTRIRRKMNKVKTNVKIQTRNEKLLILVPL